MTAKEEIKEQISKLQKKLKEIEKSEQKKSIDEYYKCNKYCIVCKNRIPELDFKISDGIVCSHPSNQNGKDKFQFYGHTCQFWEYEK